jgi:hypothetical protein
LEIHLLIRGKVMGFARAQPILRTTPSRMPGRIEGEIVANTNVPAVVTTEDFKSNPSYKRRVVAFYDVLGWRSEIEKAGTDPAKIGDLRRLILSHTRVLRMPVEAPVNVSTFSDNIVISTPVSPTNVPYFLRSIAIMQLMTASLHFLLRGGITVGDIYHDDEVVFGPALNRAYHLESRVADVPRIVLDPEVLKIGKIEGFHAVQNGITFLDPFTSEFLQFWLDNSSDRNENGAKFSEAGVPSSGKLPPLPGYVGLQGILNGLKPTIRGPLAEKEYRKVAWLYDRIAERLGQPLSSSYPRVYPVDVA